ncbi:MAG: methyltransferase [bacterium]|nr:MAG: methyltransferase [bacterium]
MGDLIDSLYTTLIDAKQLTSILKLFLALFCGGIIGYERGRHGQPAGLRTHIIIAVGSCLMMVLSIHIGDLYKGDHSRIAAQVVSGIGFLGGAAIIRFKFAVKGVTTVATIWTTAGIGLSIGGGLYLASLVASGIIMFTLMALNVWERKVFKKGSINKLVIEANRDIELITEVFKLLKNYKIVIRNLGLTEDIAKNLMEINVTVILPDQINVKSLFYDLSSFKGVLKIHLDQKDMATMKSHLH